MVKIYLVFSRSGNKLFIFIWLVIRQQSLTFFFFLNDTPPTEISPLSLHAALPISPPAALGAPPAGPRAMTPAASAAPPGEAPAATAADANSPLATTPAATEASPETRGLDQEIQRSEEHTSELQSPCNLVCRLLLEK